MTRLADSNSNKGRVGPGYIYSHVFEHFVEQHTDFGRRRRTNPTSSLDFKAEGSSLAGPHMSKKMDTGPARNQEQQQQRSASRAATRARGSSSGLPPHRYTLEELEGMDSDTFLKVLRDDPELAAAFQDSYNNNKKTQRMKRSSSSGSSSSGSSGTGGSKRGGKSSTGRVAEKDFVEDLRKGGFPVVQWSITIIVIVFAVWKLYQILSGPQASSIKKQKQARKKQPKQRKGAKEKAVEDNEASLAVEMEDVVAAPQVVQTKKKPKRSSKKGTAKPKTNTQQSAQTPAAPKVEIPRAKQQENKDAQLAADLAAGWGDDQADAGEWQTVGKKAVSNGSNAADGKPSNESSNAKPTPSNGSRSTAPPKQETKSDEKVQAEPKVEPAEEPQKENNSATKPNNKKKKKSKGKSTNGSKNTGATKPSSATDNDAMLALELQSEEEKLAKIATSQKSEDVWEEVPVRRKSRNKSSGNETEALQS